VITGHYLQICEIWTVWIVMCDYVIVRKTMFLCNFDRLCRIIR